MKPHTNAVLEWERDLLGESQDDLRRCLDSLRGCLGASSALDTSPAYAEMLLEVADAIQLEHLRHWLKDRGASCFVESASGFLSCVMEFTPEMLSELDDNPEIAEVHTIQVMSLEGGVLTHSSKIRRPDA